MVSTPYLLKCLLISLSLVFIISGTQAAEKPSIQVESDNAEHFQSEKKTTFSGNVKIYSNTFELIGDTLNVKKEGEKNHFILNGNLIQGFCTDCAKYHIHGEFGKEINFNQSKERLKMQGGVNVCANRNCGSYNIRADAIDFERKRQFLTLVGNVMGTWIVKDGMEKIQFKSDRIEANLAKNMVKLLGNAQVNRGDIKISGESIGINTKTGELSASERVKAVY